MYATGVPTVTWGSVEYVANGAGYKLALKHVAAQTKTKARRPILIIPGYGMNSFIFGFHPKGHSLESYLAAHGFDVWSADLRGQGRSRRDHGSSSNFGLAEMAIDDIRFALAHVVARSESPDGLVDVIGCSLGTALTLGHLAHHPNAPIGSFVSLGGLIRWVTVHPLLRLAFSSPKLIGKVRLRHTRPLARIALPLLVRYLPSVLAMYMNANSTDTSHANLMVQTVEDPSPRINQEIAEWIISRDLILRDVNVTHRLRGMKHPLLCVVAKHDGVVPPATARAVYELMGSSKKELLEVGDDAMKMAHADLFISHEAETRVFQHIVDFLDRHHT